jgi:hypothetical protein
MQCGWNALPAVSLTQCESGAELLKSVGVVDPICEDGGPRSRADVHSELTSLVICSLERTLRDRTNGAGCPLRAVNRHRKYSLAHLQVGTRTS